MRVEAKNIVPAFMVAALAICALGLFGCGGEVSKTTAPVDTPEGAMQQNLLESSPLKQIIDRQSQCNDPTDFRVVEFSYEEDYLRGQDVYKCDVVIENNIVTLESDLCLFNRYSYEFVGIGDIEVKEIHAGPTKFPEGYEKCDPDFSGNKISTDEEGHTYCLTPIKNGEILSWFLLNHFNWFPEPLSE